MRPDAVERMVAGAFPRAYGDDATTVAALIQPRLMVSRFRAVEIVQFGEELQVPRRLSLRGQEPILAAPDRPALMALCLRTRSGNGYEREAAAAAVAAAAQPFAAPFLLLLAADHVEPVARAAAAALPTLPDAVWRALALENRPLLRSLRARITRRDSQDGSVAKTPGLAMLRAIEQIAMS